MSNNQQPTINIALCFDNNYLMSAETLIKSVCRHNRNVIFHVIYQELPTEWFEYMQAKLSPLNCEIRSVPFKLPALPEQQNKHVTLSSYLRYFIADLIDSERVLYLDTDIIVTGRLQNLFTLDMQNKVLAAVEDTAIMHFFTYGYAPFEDNGLNLAYHGGKFQSYFNSGVMLIDTVKWKEIPRLTERLLAATCRYDNVDYGDQDILNFMFHNQWLPLSVNYNLMTSTIMNYVNWQHKLGNVKNEYNLIDIYGEIPSPKIIHYSGTQKPWLEEYKNFTSFHRIYQEYSALKWESIH